MKIVWVVEGVIVLCQGTALFCHGLEDSLTVFYTEEAIDSDAAVLLRW